MTDLKPATDRKSGEVSAEFVREIPSGDGANLPMERSQKKTTGKMMIARHFEASWGEIGVGFRSFVVFTTKPPPFEAKKEAKESL